MIALKKYIKNPILKPIKTHAWEKYVYNCGAILLDNRIHIVYRALSNDRISRLGYAVSKDGFKIDGRLERPIYIPQSKAEQRMVRLNNAGVEDPRLTRIKNRIYMVYAAEDGRLSQVAMASIKVDDFLQKQWKWKRHGILFPGWYDRNAVLFPEKINGKYVLYHRLRPNIWISYSPDLKRWSKPKIIMRPRKGMWDEFKIGAAAPPIKLRDKWLLIYHGVEQEEKGYVYRLGYVFIDSKNPEKILFRSKQPILEPIKDYEKKGQVPNVVFSCGAVVKQERLFVYYGGADTVIGVATTDISKLL